MIKVGAAASCRRVTTAILSAIILIWGVVLTVGGERNGVKMLILGAVCAAIAAVGIPYGIRRGRM